MIRPAGPDDLAAIAAISDASIRNEAANFAGQPEGLAVWEARFAREQPRYPWLVGVDPARPDHVLGFAKAGPFREKAAYDWLAETSVYLDPAARGRGLGRELYLPLLEQLRARGFHAALGVVALPNPASVALHERCGFRKVGHIERAGWKLDRWWDVGLWRLELGAASTPPPPLA